MFCWPIYYGHSDFDHPLIKTLEDIFRTYEKSAEKFLSIQELGDSFSEFVSSKPALRLGTLEMPQFSNTFKLSRKFTYSEAARGNYLHYENTDFIITDLNWFAHIIDVLSTSSLKSDSSESLTNVLG